MDIHARLANRLRILRSTQNLSLEALAALSGVSRSNISLIERGASSPTATVLDRLATALGVTLAGLFEEPAAAEPPSPLLRSADQPVWTDPASGYVRRKLSPDTQPNLQLVAVEFPAGQRVAYESGTRERRVEQQVWLLEGRMEITVADQTWALAPGDCLAMRLDGPILFVNPGTATARYLVARAAFDPLAHRSTP